MPKKTGCYFIKKLELSQTKCKKKAFPKIRKAFVIFGLISELQQQYQQQQYQLQQNQQQQNQQLLQ